jgi:hypothetical protein
MRLRIHAAAANDELVGLINEGYSVIAAIQAEYRRRKDAGAYVDDKNSAEIIAPMNEWVSKAAEALDRIFPTPLEKNLFVDPDIPFGSVAGDYQYQSAMRNSRYFIRGLNKIRLQSIPEYTDLPLDARLFVEDIDSFHKVRDINPAAVASLLNDGYLDRSEDFIQTAFERILNVPFHKKDWGGEQNDLYTANLVVNSSRNSAAFMLKGNGLRAKSLEIKHCGANGDQLLRLCASPAKLFIVQFVGRIAEAVIADVDGKIRHARAEGREAWYCIVDGQDTVRVLRGYGEI